MHDDRRAGCVMPGVCRELPRVTARLGRGVQMTPEIFWAMTKRMPNGCLEFMGSRDLEGYGRFGARSTKVHRYAYRISHGRLLVKDEVLHMCDNPPCVEPSHIF